MCLLYIINAAQKTGLTKKHMLSLYYIFICGTLGAVIPVSRSRFGHNIVDAKVGDKTPVSFAVHLQSSDSLLFDRRHCPLFINCYDTGVQDGSHSVPLRLGSMEILDFQFRVTDNDGFISDVGGVLDMSPRGRIALDSRILFHASVQESMGSTADDSFDYEEEQPATLFMSFDNHDAGNDDHYVSFPLVDNGKLSNWTVSDVRMSIGDSRVNNISMHMEVNPFHPFITFPESMRDAVFGALKQSFGVASINWATSTVDVPCDSFTPETFVITLAGRDGSVQVALQMPTKPRTFPFYDDSHPWSGLRCPTVINFENIDHIILGSPLLRNRYGIALDGVNKQVLVDTRSVAFQAPDISPSPLVEIPAYQIRSLEMKDFWNGQSYELRVTMTQANLAEDCAYLPVTNRPVDVTDAHVPGTIMYIFERVISDGRSDCGSKDQALPVFVHLLNDGRLEFNMDKQTVAIPFEFVSTIEKQAYRGEIVHDRYRMLLILTPIEVEVQYKDLHMGAFSEQQDHEEMVECVICNNRIVPGEYKQGLRGCSHVFHDECIERKFSKERKYGCPTCGKFTGFERGAFIMERYPREEELHDSS